LGVRNQPSSSFVDIRVFRPNTRRSPFADFIDWTDYRFDGPLHQRAPFQSGQRRRRHRLVRILIFLAIAWAISRLIRGRRYSSWF
jgi:hypothetical protein